MYLKSIEVQGFKSFANKMVFEFHNGITGIVGPNGSGKSNVADAVRWVLGEQSAKQLRGGNMQDVIFSGTELRKPQGFASVAITLDNSDHKLDIEFEEVTVTRRLYRSGESEYMINGSACRLKDINELFYDTGIGKEGYSIIGQGQIDKILSGKPEERRELFDEAAGIVKFKRRKNATIKKLEEEKQNLVRVNDILSELTSQLGPLEKQSAVAKIYLQKKEELKQLDINMFLLDLDRTKRQLSEIEQKYEVARSDLEDTQNQFDQTKQEYEKLEQDMDALDEKIEAMRTQSNQNALIKQQLEGQVNVLKEQINAAHLNDEHYQKRVDAIAQDRTARQEEKAGLQEERKALQEKLVRMKEKQDKQMAAVNELQKTVDGLNHQIEEGKNEVIELLNQRSSAKGKMQRYDAMLEQIGIRKAELNQRLLRLKSEESGHTEEFARAREEAAAVESKIEKLLGESQDTEKQIQELQRVIAEQNRQIDVGQTAYHREASKLESLKNLTERYDGYGGGIRKVMEQKEKNPGIRGVVADLIHVKKQYELAVETALGGSIRNIVTDNENTAKYMIDFLKRSKAGRATFLPLTNISNKRQFSTPQALNEPGVIGLASTLTEVEPEYANLNEYLLGRTLVVDHIDHAIAIGRKYRHSLYMVTLEGDSFSPGGSMTGGAFKTNSNLLGRRREIEELEESVQTLKKEMDDALKSIEQNRTRRNELRQKLAEINEELQKARILQNTVRLNMKQAEAKNASIAENYGQLNRENREIESQIREVEENNSSILTELKAFEKREQELDEQITRLQKEMEEKQESREKESQTLESIHLEYAALEQQDHFLVQNLNRIIGEMERLDEELSEIQTNLSLGSKEIEEKETNIEKIKQTIEAAAEQAKADEEKIRTSMKEKEQMTAIHRGFFEKRDDLSKRINLLDKECYRLNSQKERLEEGQESQISYMWEEYEITPVSAQKFRMEEVPERGQLKKDIAHLKDSIRKLGSVNVNAIEEYKKVLERHTFLSAQHEDLVKAEATLLGIIEELDAGMRKQFTEKFEAIRVEYDKAFKELFGGGKGTLELTEDEDVLEAGIKIVSQPPGKKLQNMMQLSGGEKALSAIALLFAIQNLKPSPFCLLDEIEAALDDSNVTRYAQYLHKLTKNTQFIIITHRRGTMNAADRLYGITMQEKGVSTLVSVDLIENDLDK
ncbi:MAG: chromosome segregation protein SMC [Lachnospiraceae bacterium]|nr:chromosome segregation protein SMC [Lachnospiraceae bacterium]